MLHQTLFKLPLLLPICYVKYIYCIYLFCCNNLAKFTIVQNNDEVTRKVFLLNLNVTLMFTYYILKFSKNKFTIKQINTKFSLTFSFCVSKHVILYFYLLLQCIQFFLHGKRFVLLYFVQIINRNRSKIIFTMQNKKHVWVLYTLFPLKC